MVFNISCDQVVSIPSHCNTMQKNYGVTLSCSPFLFEVTLKQARFHGVDFSFSYTFVDVTLPLVSLFHILIAFYHIIDTDILEFTFSTDILFVVIHKSQMIKFDAICFLFKAPISSILKTNQTIGCVSSHLDINFSFF